MFNNTSIPVLQQLAQFAQARHAVLAGNIANMDTPGYRVRDLSPHKFQELLKTALHERDLAQSAAATGPSYGLPPVANPTAGPAVDALRQVSENLQGILYHDDSNDSLEQQIAELTKNQMQHNLAVTIMTSQFRLLHAAISERT